jgi:hypothetical protein
MQAAFLAEKSTWISQSNDILGDLYSDHCMTFLTDASGCKSPSKQAPTRGYEVPGYSGTRLSSDLLRSAAHPPRLCSMRSFYRRNHWEISTQAFHVRHTEYCCISVLISVEIQGSRATVVWFRWPIYNQQPSSWLRWMQISPSD